MDQIDWLAKHLGVSHFNAGMMVLMVWLLSRWFKGLVASIEEHSKSLGELMVALKLSQQWQENHDESDERRFDELHRRLDER